MFKGLFALAAAMVATQAGAVSYLGQVEGVVTSRFDTYFTRADASATIAVGDRILATFSYDNGNAGNGTVPVGQSMLRSLSQVATHLVTFRIGNHLWTSRGDFLGAQNPTIADWGSDPLRDYYSTMDDAPGAGDLHVEGYAFEIGEFGYDLYEGYGYRGVFDPASIRLSLGDTATVGNAAAPVPEKATWVMMILGFGMLGGGLRVRRHLKVARPSLG